MKSEGMLHAMVMRLLKRQQVPLDRDVIWLAVADEEVNSIGSKWMLQNGRELIAGAEYLINEGGENLVDENGGVPMWGVTVAEKMPFWLRLRTRGKAGHGSIPDYNAATHRLVRALARVAEFERPLRVLPAAQRILCDEARLRYPDEKEKLCNLEQSQREAYALDDNALAWGAVVLVEGTPQQIEQTLAALAPTTKAFLAVTVEPAVDNAVQQRWADFRWGAASGRLQGPVAAPYGLSTGGRR